MGSRGPAARPAVLRELDGNPGKRGVNKSAPRASGAAECPDFLKPYAREIWQRVVKSLPSQLFGACDAPILSAYCVAVEMHRKAAMELESSGEISVGEGGALYQNPWLSILNRQAGLMATLGTRLGLDPASRASLSVPPDAPDSKFSGLIAIKGGRKG